MKYKEYHGYKIHEDGTITGLNGRPVKQRIRNNRREIKLNVDGKRKNFIVSRLVYCVFYPFDWNDKNLCVSFKDGNSLNVHLSNLYLTNRKDLIQGSKHRNRAKLTDKQVKQIRQLYKGKAGNSQYDKEGYSLQDIANMYGVTKSNIYMILKGKSRNQKKYKLK